jgi:hypothetical protein
LSSTHVRSMVRRLRSGSLNIASGRDFLITLFLFADALKYRFVKQGPGVLRRTRNQMQPAAAGTLPRHW